MAGIELELLGAPKVTIDGAPLEVDTRKAIALLAYLAVTGQERQRDSLSGLLWPEYEPTHARAALRRTLSALNKALRGRALQVNRGALGVDPGELSLDVDRFRGLLQGCREHAGKPSERCPGCLDSLAGAVGLYRDDFMAGFTLRDCPEFDEWMFFESESLKRDMVQALQRLVRGATATDDLQAAVHHARRWLRFDPLHEPAHQELMKLYALSGRRSAALAHYRDCVALLDRELGVPPLEETTRLYGAIRDERIGPSPSPDLQVSSLQPVRRATTTPRTAPGLPLVGRDDEARALRAAFIGVGPSGCLVGIEGEAGIGKTRLIEDFLATVTSDGAPVLSVRCHADEGGLAFGVMAEGLREALASQQVDRLEASPRMWLAEAARILPELESRLGELPAPPPLDVPGARARFLEGLAHV
ncbi:MAG TPA: BTAD domain-containing putative transcriptional regulator, partial [Actinomycetota bacterium]|nr:BTAD domain-containing putative transcriptional regulator [Actinomycetota bacterium]